MAFARKSTLARGNAGIDSEIDAIRKTTAALYNYEDALIDARIQARLAQAALDEFAAAKQ